MQIELENLVRNFEKVAGERISAVKALINELQNVFNSNVQVIAVREDIQRVKNAIDLAQRDILQKEQVR